VYVPSAFLCMIANASRVEKKEKEPRTTFKGVAQSNLKFDVVQNFWFKLINLNQKTLAFVNLKHIHVTKLFGTPTKCLVIELSYVRYVCLDVLMILSELVTVFSF